MMKMKTVRRVVKKHSMIRERQSKQHNKRKMKNNLKEGRSTRGMKLPARKLS